MPRTSMLHVRVDDKLKADATEKLAEFGLTISDAVRILRAAQQWPPQCR